MWPLISPNAFMQSCISDALQNRKVCVSQEICIIKHANGERRVGRDEYVQM